MFLLISGGKMACPHTATKVRETFRQITKKLWTTKTGDLDKLFIY